MTKVPSIDYKKAVKALQRDGWVVVRQRGSHIRLQKHLHEETLKLTIPVYGEEKLKLTTEGHGETRKKKQLRSCF